MELDECDLDEFVLFYIKHRIEYDHKFLWHDAPHVRTSLGFKGKKILNAAVYIEQRKLLETHNELLELIKTNYFDFRHCKFILDDFLNAICNSQNSLFYDISPFTVRLLTIISFSGFLARILAELDDKNYSGNVDYRKQLYQLSIYSSNILQITMKEKNYSWDLFHREVENLSVKHPTFYSQLFRSQHSPALLTLGAITGTFICVGTYLILKRISTIQIK